jgi:hypothetical protein
MSRAAAGLALLLFTGLMLAAAAMHPLLPQEPVPTARLVLGDALWPQAHLLPLLGAALFAGGLAQLLPRGQRAGAVGVLVAFLGAGLLAASLVVELTGVPALARGTLLGSAAAAQALEQEHVRSVLAFNAGDALLAAGAWLVVRAVPAARLPARSRGSARVALPWCAALSLLAEPLAEPGRALVGMVGLLGLLAWAGWTGLGLLAGPSRLRAGRGAGRAA